MVYRILRRRTQCVPIYAWPHR